jgi:2-hydroxychromene-2-carboxylate isomerase
MSDAKHRYILNDIRRLTKKYGLDIKWPVDKEPWWELSHLGYLKAQQLGCGNAFFWQTYCARWQKGLDISQPLVISKLCRDAGIRKSIVDKILEAPQDPQIRELGVSILYRIYREDIFGVPMFTKKRMQFWGLDRLNDFLEATDHSLRTTNDLNMMQGYPLDFDHAGGCG